MLKVKDKTGKTVDLMLDNDSGWINATLTERFTNYNNSPTTIVKYRKTGNVVEIRGCISPTSIITKENVGNDYRIFTLPVGYRPSFYAINQGQYSGNHMFHLSVSNDGTVDFSNYRSMVDGSAVDCQVNAWLPINFIFTV